MDASEKHKKPAHEHEFHNGVSWGPKLFWITLLVTLVFFWWLLIYSHGIETGHG